MKRRRKSYGLLTTAEKGTGSSDTVRDNEEGFPASLQLDAENEQMKNNEKYSQSFIYETSFLA